MMFFLGSVALLAALGDIRMMLAGGLEGAHRIARHLWRMCFLLFIASGSFFLGQAKVIPKPIRIFPLLAIPALLPLVLLLYWLARVLFTKWYRRRANDFFEPTPVPSSA
jgi:amino acid permease